MAAFSYQRAFQRALRMEEAFGEAAFYDLATGKDSFSQFSGGSDAAEPTLSFGATPLYCLFLLADDQAVHRHLMERYQQWASQPYFQSKADWSAPRDRSGMSQEF